MVTRLADIESVPVAEGNLLPQWIIRPLILWVLWMAAASAAWLAWHVNPMRAAVGISGVVATLAIGGLLGWHRHWRALPLLGVAPALIFLLAWIGLFVSDPSIGAVGLFAVSSFAVVFVVATVIYPLSLAVLSIGALVGVACQRLVDDGQ